jgi:MoaA/NifB/PqqE/SkfB family radical SAM enzyme
VIWNDLLRDLSLDGVQIERCLEVLGRLRTQYARLCSRPWKASSGQSPLTELSQYIVSTQADALDASAKLLSLLRRAEPGEASRLDEAYELSDRAYEEFTAVLGPDQRKAWRSLAPDNLLDIELDGCSAFDDALSEAIAGVHRPDGFLCTSPFEYAHLQANGDVYPCCPSKFGKIIGHVETESLTSVWNSAAADDVRASMLDGSYRYCNASACEYLRDANAKSRPLSPPALVAWARAKGLLTVQATPRIINFAFDRICNLACSYCRATAFRPTSADRNSIRLIDGNIFDSLLVGTERIILLGEGDPFASPFYRDKLRRYDWARHPRLRIKIQTNGLLLTRAMWKSVAASHVAIDWISVSVDAATPETFRVNRGGDFDLLVRNLYFIAELFAQKKLRHFHVNFLVQANNYREIPAFARLGKSLGCDLIEFQRLENWGTYTHDEYMRYAVHEADHPEHAGLREILRDPELTHTAIWLLKLGACAPSRASVDLVSYDS